MLLWCVTRRPPRWLHCASTAEPIEVGMCWFLCVRLITRLRKQRYHHAYYRLAFSADCCRIGWLHFLEDSGGTATVFGTEHDVMGKFEKILDNRLFSSPTKQVTIELTNFGCSCPFVYLGMRATSNPTQTWLCNLVLWAAKLLVP